MDYSLYLTDGEHWEDTIVIARQDPETYLEGHGCDDMPPEYSICAHLLFRLIESAVGSGWVKPVGKYGKYTIEEDN